MSLSSFVSPLFQKRKGVGETSIFNSPKRLRHVEEKPMSNNNAPQIKYDVFVSFRGQIRNGFLSHLIDAFTRNLINVFEDDRLEKGEEVWPSIVEAIEESSISLIIFSEDYASSRWCLEEVVTILKRRDEYGQIVIPVFYKVKPTDVRHQSSDSYKKAFVEHQENNETNIQIWRDALKRAANISGIESSSWKNDAELVKEIVHLVLVLKKKLVKFPEQVPNKLRHGYGGSYFLLNERDKSSKDDEGGPSSCIRSCCFSSVSEMSRNFDMIAAIDDTKETFKVAVRIVDLWFVQTREKSKHIEMVLMDGKKHKIHAIVKKEELETWETELKEGRTYYMYNFRVVPNDGQYKVCQHPFKLFFTGGTTLRQVELPDIPLKSYEFKSFEDITNGNYDPNILIDIIGVVEEIRLQLPTGNPPKVVFNLKDLSAKVISCTLWSDHATKFMVYLKDNVDLASMIIVLTQARVKPPHGIHGLTISNSLYGSKLFINDEVLDFVIYRERLSTANLGEASNVSQSLSLGQQSQGSEFTKVDRFMYKCHVINLSKIPDVVDGSNICTVGTTSKLIARKGGWFYNSCTRCTRKADHEDVAYICSCGKYNEKSIPRYRVEVMVSYKKGFGNFVFWDRDCTHVIGMSAANLREIMIQSQEGGPKHFPDPLDKLLGLTVAIKCKYQSNFNSYSVTRMSDDANIIKAITDQMCLLEEAGIMKPSSSEAEVGETSLSQIEGVVQDNNEAADIMKQSSSEAEVGDTSLSQTEGVVKDNNPSLSATAEHDPDQHTILTPTKRSSSQLSSDDYPLEDTPSAQLSVTKLTKHINKE